MDLTISTAITIAFGLIFGVMGYLFVQRDKQREKDIESVEQSIKDTAKLVLEEKDKTAKLVLEESRLNTALVLAEKEKLEARFKTEYKELEEKFVQHQILMAREYATTVLVEKITTQVTNPIMKKLDELERVMDSKVDRREFDQHQIRVSGK